MFPIPTIREFMSTLDRMAIPYRVDSSRRATPSDYQVPKLDASNGFIGSVRDIANFEAALDGTFLVTRTTRELAWQRRFGGPMGYGWFVQQVNGKKVVWHFGLEPNAFSSLVIKVPNDGLTLILLANSDGLTAPFRRELENGDVTVSPFAKIFFSLLG